MKIIDELTIHFSNLGGLTVGILSWAGIRNWRILMLHTVQEAQKSQEKYPGVLLYIFEIHYMRASKRRITGNCNRTRSRDSYLHNLRP